MEKGLLEILKFPKTFIDINPEHLEIILHCCKSVLLHNGEAWIKKSGYGAFHAPHGLFDGTKFFEIDGAVYY